MGGGGGDDDAAAAADQDYLTETVKSDPSPVVLYATTGYLILAVLAIWPIGK
jgi:hypothetical protein